MLFAHSHDIKSCRETIADVSKLMQSAFQYFCKLAKPAIEKRR